MSEIDAAAAKSEKGKSADPIKASVGELTRSQKAGRKTHTRFNIISGGKKCGSTLIAVDTALSAPYGAWSTGSKVAFFVHDMEAFYEVRRLFAKVIPKLVLAGRTSNRFDLVNGGSVSLFCLDKGVIDLIDPVSMVVVDDVSKIDGFYDLWQRSLKSFVAHRGQAWLFGKPSGPNNDFGRLITEAKGREWQVVSIPSTSNPEMREEVRAGRRTLPLPAFLQQYAGIMAKEHIEMSVSQTVIGSDETFLDWCERLEKEGLKVDGHPFRLDNRPTMRWVYSLIPSTPEEAFGKRLILMKCAQVGFTVMEMLAMIYLSIKFMPCKVGMYLPDQNLAKIKSSDRFLPIVRTIPDAYRMLTEDPSGSKKTGEGNVMTRNMAESRFYFLWTSGKGATESIPLDVVSFDEVQEMSIADMEKTSERLSASRIRYTLMGSTANWPDRDIHFFYKKGTQHQFWTECPHCETHQILDEHFPECIRLREVENPDWQEGDDEADRTIMDYRYVCHECGGVIEDSQRGEWRPANPEAKDISVHYPQFLSPTISPREIIESYFNADDMKNFFNRKRGKPYLDPSQVPVDLEMLNECARLGMEMGVVWKQRASNTFMGIDQMGQFNVVLIAERLASGHMAVIHAEEIYDEDPFGRCDVLMAQYGVSVCVVETLPNYNDAKRFAARHPGKVFLAGYQKIDDDMMRWGDSVPSKMDRKTSEEDRDRYTVSLDQYKCMQVAMKRITSKVCVFPDPMGLVQEVHEKGLKHIVPVLKDRVFLHFTRTALVADMDEEERKFKRRVVKVGIDPHFSYAYMLLNVAWARSHGTSMFLNPVSEPAGPRATDVIEKKMPGLPSAVVNMMELSGDVCGRCISFENGTCTDRGLIVGPKDPGCHMFLERGDEVR